MLTVRKVSVYGLAALVGFAAAYLLLPRDGTIKSDPPIGEGNSEKTESSESAVSRQEGAVSDQARRQGGEAVPASTGELMDDEAETTLEGPNENPHARRIREALSTPGHELIARCSPVWVQVKRELRAQSDETWLPQVEAILDLLRKGSRDMDLAPSYIIREQNALLESLWNSELNGASGGALGEVLSVLSERIEAFEG